MTEAAAVHACWSYDDPALLDRHAGRFISDGLAAGERVWFVPGPRSGITADWLRGVTPRSSPAGAVRVVPWQRAYVAGQVIDPAAQMAAYAAVTEQALADGFTGFRVVADVTELARTAEQREAFARYEYAIGRYMRLAPMRALCTYDRLELGDRVVGELACLHQASHADGVIFQLHAGPRPGEAELDGELDMDGVDLFATALPRTDLGTAGGQVLVDATGLRFIDHRSLLALQGYAQARGLTAVLRTRLTSAAHLADLLDIPSVRVELAP